MKYLTFTEGEEQMFADLYAGFGKSGSSQGPEIHRVVKIYNAMAEVTACNEPIPPCEVCGRGDCPNCGHALVRRKIELKFNNGQAVLSLEDADFSLLKKAMRAVNWRRTEEASRAALALSEKLESASDKPPSASKST